MTKSETVNQHITISDITEAQQLALAKERARIASDLHDNMGNRLISSINNLNLALIQPTLETARPFIDAAASSARASLMALRKIVEGLSPVNFDEAELIPLINSVIDRVSAAGIRADLRICGDMEKLSAQQKEFIYNACQEALMNAVIHGKADGVYIKLSRAANFLNVDIVDNGLGCAKIVKNRGLAAMEERVKTLGGTIRFASPSVGGFGIYAEIPAKAGEEA